MRTISIDQRLGWIKRGLISLCGMWALLAAVPVSALNITLNFNTLPSAQGWTYYSALPFKPEADAFSVAGNILSMDSTGTTAAYYFLPGGPDPQFPFTITTRARVLNGYGDWLLFYATTATHFAIFSLGLDHISGYDVNNGWMTIASLDNTVFHDFRLEGTPNISAKLFVDDSYIGTIPFNLGSGQAVYIFGDGGGVGEGTAEITNYSIVQNTVPVPEPSTVPLFSIGLVGLLWYGWRQRKRLT